MCCTWPHSASWSVRSMKNYIWKTASEWFVLDKGQGCWKWIQKALRRLILSLNHTCVFPFSFSSVGHSFAGGNAPYWISAPVTLIKHQKYLPLVWEWVFTVAAACRLSTLVEKTPTVIDRWGDYHQKHYHKEVKKGAKCWWHLEVKWQQEPQHISLAC